MALDIRRQIPATFDRVERSKYGYNAKQVDAFLSRARTSFENPVGAADQVSSADVRDVAFDPVKGGYDANSVDAALDRLEDAFARRERDDLISQQGEEAWLRQIGKLSGILRGRLHRPDGERFRRVMLPNVPDGRVYALAREPKHRGTNHRTIQCRFF